MIIIKATIRDIDQLVELFDAYRVWYRKPSDPETAKSFLTERIEKGESEIYLAVTEAGKAVGFTQLYPIFSSTRMKRMWLLNDLYVAPDFRGQGISKLLINRTKQLTNDTNACGILLETEKSNTIGNQLYPGMGFELESNHFYFWTKE